MQCSVRVVVELDAEAGIGQMEQAVVDAGRRAMREALAQGGCAYEAAHAAHAAHAACPHCGDPQSQSQGTVTRRVATGFGRVVLCLRRQRCAGCGRRFRPAQGGLVELAGNNVTPELGAACAVAGASWPYATAVGVLHRLCGAQVSHEEVRRWTVRLGTQQAQAQHQDAERRLAPTAEQVRRERDQPARPVRLGRATTSDGAGPAAPARLLVGLDGGWLPSRDQAGGMEGKVGVVATGVEAVGQHGRQRLTPRRYVATFSTSEQIGTLTDAAAVALGGQDAREQVVLGDGAAWIKTQAQWHFPDALHILDWAHVSRALHRAIRAACPGRVHRILRRALHRTLPDTLWHGDLEATLTALRELRPTPPAEPVSVREDTLRYLQGQRAWLGNYAAWQAAGYPVGSGLIERAVALVINWRMKRRGMRWRRTNASAVVALRVRELTAAWDARDPPTPSPRAA